MAVSHARRRLLSEHAPPAACFAGCTGTHADQRPVQRPASSSHRAPFRLPCRARRDMLLRMRADEVCIRDINWRLAGLAPGTSTDAVAVRQFRA